MTDEPYRWLEAIQNRREYVEDRLSGGSPVVAINGAPGILLLTVKAPTPKLFEVYDHLAMGSLGHPADMEKVRQAAIDAAHVEGFSRSRHDVSSRRLVNYSLGPALKNAFEHILSAPIMFRGQLLELAGDPASDLAWTINYDGTYQLATPAAFANGLLSSGQRDAAIEWEGVENKEASPEGAPGGDGWPRLAGRALRLLAWARSPKKDNVKTPWPEYPAAVAELLKENPVDHLEYAVLDRALLGRPIMYRVPSPSELGF